MAWEGPQVGFLLLGHLLWLLLPPYHLYICGERAPHKDTQLPSRVRRPPPLFTSLVIFSYCLGEALWRSLHYHRHHTVVLTKLIYYLDVLLDQEGEGRHRAEHVQNSEVPYVRYLIGRS